MPFSLTNFLESSLNRHGVPVVRRDQPQRQPQRPRPASPLPLSNTQRAFLPDCNVTQYRRNLSTNEIERVPERDTRERRPVRIVLPQRAESQIPRTVSVDPAGYSDDESTLVDYPYVADERISPRRWASWFSPVTGSDKSGNRGSRRPAPSPRYFEYDVEDREPSQNKRHQQYQHQNQHQHHPHRRHSTSYSYSPYENVNIETRSPRARPSTRPGYPSSHSYSYSPYEGVNIETRSPGPRLSPRPRPRPRPTPNPNWESRYGFGSAHREDPYAGVNIEDRSPSQGPAYEHQHQNESQRQFRQDLRSPGYEDRDGDTDDDRVRGVRFTEFDETRNLRDGATILERTPRPYSRGGRE